MPSQKSIGSPSPPTSSIRLPGEDSRRASFASPESPADGGDREPGSLALGKIHTTASHSDTLTTFDEFSSPPRPPISSDSKGLTADMVQGGLSGLYSRIRATVSTGKDSSIAVPGGTTSSSPDDSPAKIPKARPSPIKSTITPTITSAVPVSESSSRLNSPLNGFFPNSHVLSQQPSPSNVSLVSGISIPGSHSSAGEPGQHSPEEARQSWPPSSPANVIITSPSTPRPADTGKKSRSSNLASDLRANSPLPDVTPDLPKLPDQLNFPKSDANSFSSNDGPSMDQERTPRPLQPNRDKERSFYERPSASPLRMTMANDDDSDSRPVVRMAPTLSSGHLTSNRPPPMIQVSQAHLPGFSPSRAGSSEGGFSSAASAIAASRRATTEISSSKAAGTEFNDTHEPPNRLKSKVLARELWMRDETAKECFYCGDMFSTFRRKHHCRICGNIFDAKCTTLVPGKLFGQSGRLRICRPCEAIVNGTEDDSSEYSEDLDRMSTHGHRLSAGEHHGNGDGHHASTHGTIHVGDDHTAIGMPMMGIPVSRKHGENKRGSAVIEFGGDHHSLVRPSSSKSLKSLSGLHRTSSHKRHHSRQGHQHMKSLKANADDRAPFQRQEAENPGKPLLALHRDNIIDPDLAPFMSDEGSSEDENMSIFATLNADSQSPGKGDIDKQSLSGLLGSSWRSKILGGMSMQSRDGDNASQVSKGLSRNRNRNISVSSVHHAKTSPRRSKSNSLLKGLSVPGFAGGSGGGSVTSTIQQKPLPLPPSIGISKMIRSSAMRGASAPPVELNHASLQHVRNMLRQMLQEAEIPEVKRWEKALIPILLQCTDDVNPEFHRKDDIDIRHYIKLKKIPGSKPGDTAYVSGVVFTKNLALKSMPRSISNPRILIVTFPIEYARHQQHFMSLDPVISQEREYLRNLVKRIARLNPQVLLVEKNVAGLALDFLEQAGIAVISNVKASVLNAVSRCTQTKLISSADKLALDQSELGRCASFDVKTYVHGSMKKTFTYFSGCQKDLGCTIVLRGAEMSNLNKLKRITEFLCFVVYNLKLETCVMRDEYVLIPANYSAGTLSSAAERTKPSKESFDTSPISTSVTASQNLSKSGTSGSQGSTTGDLSVGTESRTDSTVAVSTEAVSTRAASSAATKMSSEGYEFETPKVSPSPSFYNDVVEEHKTKIISSSPFVKFMQPYLLTQAREQEAKLAELRRLRDQYILTEEDEKSEDDHRFELVQPEMVHKLVQKPSKQVREFLFAVHDAEYEKGMHAYQTQKRQWEAYLSSNPTMFDPFNHQRIAVLYSMVNSKTNPCVGPDVIALSFYNEHDLDQDFLPDITLGQYVEDLCQSANTECTANGCDEALFNHHRQYVHGEGQMSVIVQKYPPRIRGMQDTILMWSCCRICGQETQVMPMSPNTWKYSFGKYLELTFWSTELHPRAHACPHDIHRNHVRYFGFNNMAVRIQYDSIQLYDIIVPRPTITWKVDSDLKLKNELFLKFKSRLDHFMLSVKARIESIHVESVAPEKVDSCSAEVERLTICAADDHERLTRTLQEKYMNSRYYEIIPLNRAGRAIHENSIVWDNRFFDFENDFFPSEKDIRRMTALQLKKIFESATSFQSIDEENDVQATEKQQQVSDEPAPLVRRLSIMSPEATKNVLASVVKEDQSGEIDSSTEPLASPGGDATIEPTNPSALVLVELPEEITKREEVKHLDLAVSHELQNPGIEELMDPQSVSSGRTGSEASVDSQDLQLAAEVSETVEKMRAHSGLDESSPPDVNLSEQVTLESKIPRLVESVRRQGGLSSPPFGRAKSQPQPGGLMKPLPMGIDNTDTASSSGSQMSKTEKLRNLITEPARAFERRMVDRLNRKNASPSMIPRSVPGKRNVLNLAKHYEQLSREFERQRLRDKQVRDSRGAYPLASSNPVVEVYRDAHEAVKEHDYGDEVETSATTGRTSVDTSTLEESSVTDTTNPDEGNKNQKEQTDEDADAQQESSPPMLGKDGDVIATEQEELDESETLATGTETQSMSPNDSHLDLSEQSEKSSILKLLTNFWSERSASGWTPLDYPFAVSEHIWGDSDIIVREDEPSTIIALALSGADYRAKLRAFRKEPENATAEDIDASIERNLLYPKNTNIRYAFQNRGVRAQCKIFYAESFDAIRRKCGVAERFVESLSRCLKWDSKGGKTKSLFLKTLDDRFVLKSLSAVEVNAFFKFAPNYFAFTHQNLFNSLPSVIAKMLGLFQVTIRNPASGMEFNWFMLVMENLFYDHQPNRRFDLKGSMRNRKIQSTGERDEVLLDENLVDIIFEKPIFVREHTMKLLKASVWNDTLFLSKQNVMDYSLMAGFEDDVRDIVVGIIDCIRTYTWDKKLETWIKDRGKNKPTVTSPKDYRNRFRVAMSKYILLAPNCWHQFQAQQIQGRPVKLIGRREEEDGENEG